MPHGLHDVCLDVGANPLEGLSEVVAIGVQESNLDELMSLESLVEMLKHTIACAACSDLNQRLEVVCEATKVALLFSGEGLHGDSRCEVRWARTNRPCLRPPGLR